jgi:predicted transposase/invertase (TIGR01784 family)
MRRKNDILWKGILEEVLPDLLRFLYPDAESRFNMKRKLVFLDKELAELYPEPNKNSDTRFVDKLVKVYTTTGKANYLLIHIEVQGQYDREFTKRMFRYFYRIYDRFFEQPVIPIAIFTGPDGKRMGDRFELAYEGLELKYKFNTLYITDFKDDDLEASNNPFALVLLAAKKLLLKGKNLDKKLLEQKLLIARSLYRKGVFSRRKIKAILTFLDNYVLFEKPEMNLIFRQELDRLSDKTNTMGIIEQVTQMKTEEARVEGEETARRLFVENLLKETKFSDEKIASLSNVSISVVKKIKKGIASK